MALSNIRLWKWKPIHYSAQSIKKCKITETNVPTSQIPAFNEKYSRSKSNPTANLQRSKSNPRANLQRSKINNTANLQRRKINPRVNLQCDSHMATLMLALNMHLLFLLHPLPIVLVFDNHNIFLLHRKEKNHRKDIIIQEESKVKKK